MILMLHQPANHNHSDDPLDPAHADRNSAPVDRVRARLLAEAELRREGGLGAGVLYVQLPRAAPPAQRAAALPLDPDLVVRVHAGARGRLERRHAVSERDGDEGGARLRGEARVEEGAELPGVGGGECVEGERVTLGFKIRELEYFPRSGRRS